MRNVRGFTVLELMVAVVILSIVVSVAMAGYRGYRDRAAMLVDETNQKILQAAVKLYAYDNNALPASLSELRDQDLERAYAQVKEGKRPYTVLAYLREWLGLGIAEAQMLPPRYYNNDNQVLTCRLDPTPPARGGVSYALAPFWRTTWPGRGGARVTLQELQNLNNQGRRLIIEADVNDAQRAVFRHGRGRVTVQISAGGIIRHRRDDEDDEE